VFIKQIIVVIVFLTLIGCGGTTKQPFDFENLPEGLDASISAGSTTDIAAATEVIIKDILLSQLTICDELLATAAASSSNKHWSIDLPEHFLTGSIAGETVSDGFADATLISNQVQFESHNSTDYHGYSVTKKLILDGETEWSLIGQLSALTLDEMSFRLEYRSDGSIETSGGISTDVEYAMVIVFEGKNLSDYFEQFENYQSSEIAGTVRVNDGATECSLLGNAETPLLKCR